MIRRMTVWKRRLRKYFRLRSGDGERGVTMIELAIMSLIVTIALVAITDAIRVASRGTLMAKEKARAMALARDRLEEVKNMGYFALKTRASNYVWPDQPDPVHPLYQRKDAMPYPAAAPSSVEDPWTPETILLGAVTYWRHVKVKFVGQVGNDLTQMPDGSDGGIGGTDDSSNLALVEVDVTWASRRTGKMEQLRLTTLVANLAVGSNANGEISGSVWDDDCAGMPCSGNGSDDGVTDDKYLTWGQIVVTARHLATGQTFTTASVNGKYEFKALPNGSYIVELAGGDVARDSAYNGTADPSYMGTAAIPVDITPLSDKATQVNIWTNHSQAVSVIGRFTDVAGSPAAPHDIRVSVDDGTSIPVTFTVTITCTATPPDECWFEVPNVAWPPSGTKMRTITFEDLTAGTINRVQFCADSTANPIKDVYVGEDPALHGDNACNGTGGVCPGWDQCVTPNPGWLPVSVTGSAAVPASIQVKVWEYFNGTAQDFTDVSNVRVDLTAVGAGVGATLMVAANGTTTFNDPANGIVPVPVAPGGITIRAYMTTTGWSMDTFSLPFPTVSGATYYLEENGPAGQPLEDQRHTFVLQRVSEIRGTVWKSAGKAPGDGYGGASVVIRNAITQWSATVKCDEDGVFSHAAVPQEVTSYTIEPVGGADYVSTPTYRTVDVTANGVIYQNDFLSEPIEFILNAVNGHIAGTVSKTTAGNLVKSGAVVIASTYNGAFPTTLPSTLLTGAYSYSTVTLSDGSYRVRVATGVGTYRMYAYMMWNGALALVEQVGPVAVTAGVETTQNLVLP